MRAHLETELFVTRRRPVLRVSVRRIRDPWWVGRNVHHAHLEDLREVVDGSRLTQTVATQYPVKQYVGLSRFHHRVSTLSVEVRRDPDGLGVFVRVHLDTGLLVIPPCLVLRVQVRRIRDPWRVDPNVHHPPREDRREVVGVSGLVQTVATHSVPPAPLSVFQLLVIPSNRTNVGRLPGCLPCSSARGRSALPARPEDNSHHVVGARQVDCRVREVSLVYMNDDSVCNDHVCVCVCVCVYACVCVCVCVDCCVREVSLLYTNDDSVCNDHVCVCVCVCVRVCVWVCVRVV